MTQDSFIHVFESPNIKDRDARSAMTAETTIDGPHTLHDAFLKSMSTAGEDKLCDLGGVKTWSSIRLCQCRLAIAKGTNVPTFELNQVR